MFWQGGGHEHEVGHEHGGTEPMVIGVSFQRCALEGGGACAGGAVGYAFLLAAGAGGAHRPMGYSPEVESPKPPRALTYHGLLT